MQQRKRRALTIILIITFVLLLDITKPKECDNLEALSQATIKTLCTD